MMTKTTIVLTLAAVLGAASGAFARDSDPTDADGGGFRVQNWQAIQGHGANNAYGAFNAYDAYNAYGFVSPKHQRGFAASPTQGRRLSREND